MGDVVKTRRGMVFGVFDGLHDGHKHFLSDAKQRSEVLIVVVTRDEVSMRRKGFRPKVDEERRAESIRAIDPSFQVVMGDTADGEWHVIDEYDPDRIYLGYDQGELSEELRKMAIPFTFLDAYKKDLYKSSLIGKETP